MNVIDKDLKRLHNKAKKEVLKEMQAIVKTEIKIDQVLEMQVMTLERLVSHCINHLLTPNLSLERQGHYIKEVKIESLLDSNNKIHKVEIHLIQGRSSILHIISLTRIL